MSVIWRAGILGNAADLWFGSGVGSAGKAGWRADGESFMRVSPALPSPRRSRTGDQEAREKVTPDSGVGRWLAVVASGVILLSGEIAQAERLLQGPDTG